jgi:hypothetical protein
MTTLACGLMIAPQVERVMKSEGISLAELSEMVNKAAITTHHRGNRRFHSWVFDVHQGQVWKMSHVDEVRVRKAGTLDLTVFEEHEACEGDGCKECGYAGEQYVTYFTTARKSR